MDKRQLLDLEAKILTLLKDSSGNLLDDETLIAILNSAKQTSGKGWVHVYGVQASTYLV